MSVLSELSHEFKAGLARLVEQEVHAIFARVEASVAPEADQSVLVAFPAETLQENEAPV